MARPRKPVEVPGVTRGERLVIARRALGLSDELRLLAVMRRDERVAPRLVVRQMIDAEWAAQQLASSCDRALGVRERLADLVRRDRAREA